MLDLDVKVQRPLAAIEFLALSVRTFEFALDVVCTPPVVFLSPRAVSFILESVQVFIVKVFDFETLEQEVISLFRDFVYLGK